MFPTIPHAHPDSFALVRPVAQVHLFVKEDQSELIYLSQEHQTIVSVLENVAALEKIWQTLAPIENDTDVFYEEEDLQYESVLIEYSRTIEVTRNFVGEIPPQSYVWDDDD
jgi:hypothetical protein